MPGGAPVPPLTVKEAILDSEAAAGSHAIEGVDGRAMTYGELRAHMRRTVARLNGAGYRRNDRIATVVNNGPEAYAALVCLMAGFAIVPTNPALREGELEGHLRATKAKAVVVEEPSDLAAQVARGMGLGVIVLVKEGSQGSLGFGLAGSVLDGKAEAEPDYARPGDLMAVFGTSGTTGRPKIVPQTQSNILWGQHYYTRNYMDTPQDRCLAFLPIFLSYGLTAPLRTLFTGGCVIVAPAFDPAQFYGWLDRSRATWMAAGPTMYMAMLDHAEGNRETIARSRLRFAHVGSAVTSAEVMDRVERTFGVPVLDGYAMTEASSITTSPLPPMRRKKGSVGISRGTEVAVMGEDGSLRPAGETGEIVVRGEAVMSGYENDPEANAAAFRGGWFRTGDIGYLDGDGFLFMRGRMKDIINRGGTKVIPQEVEEAILAHPEVREAVVFSVRHPKLGEDIAAAVVLRDGAAATDRELKAHVASRLAYHKIPNRVFIVKRLPKGQGGKVMRAGILESLGLASVRWGEADYVEPRTETERRLVAILGRLFPEARIGAGDNFFDLGGHSLMAVRLFKEMEAEFGVRLPLSALYQAPTVGEMAALVDGKPAEGVWRRVVPLVGRGATPPLFLIHGGDGDVINYQEFVRAMGGSRRVYGIQAKGLDGREEPERRVEAMAGEYLGEILRAEAVGPYYLMGFSAGGVIAYETARQMSAAGRRVGFVGMVDIEAPSEEPAVRRRNTRRAFFRQIYFLMLDLAGRSPRKKSGLDMRLLMRVKAIFYSGLNSVGIRVSDVSEVMAADAIVLPGKRRRVWRAQAVALLGYSPGEYDGKVTLYQGEGIPFFSPLQLPDGWEKVARGGVDVHRVPGRLHGSQLRSPNVGYLAGLVARALTKLDEDRERSPRK